jgi:hypothetical protein
VDWRLLASAEEFVQIESVPEDQARVPEHHVIPYVGKMKIFAAIWLAVGKDKGGSRVHVDQWVQFIFVQQLPAFSHILPGVV